MILFNPTLDPFIKFDSENVYAPSDDSYLLIDYFKKKLEENNLDGIKLEDINNILDLGTGTGVIAIFFQLIKIHNLLFNPTIFASDILEEAIECSKMNELINTNNNQIKFLQSDLFTSFPKNLQNTFEIIIFNPPYLQSSQLIKEGINKKRIDYSWDGGVNGFEILIEFLTKSMQFLNFKKKHYIYYITSSKTNLKELNKIIKNLGYINESVDKKHIFFEDIILNRLKYNQD